MVTAGITSRPVAHAAPAPPSRPQRNPVTWVLVGIPILLALAVAWQVTSNMLRTESSVRSPVSVSRVSLEADPLGSRIDLVLGDRVGQETTLTGGMTIKLREPDGTVWQSTRGVTPADFAPIQMGGLLAGRMGYSVVIPTTDWLRAPRRGGTATVTVSVVPAEGTPFASVADERFP